MAYSRNETNQSVVRFATSARSTVLDAMLRREGYIQAEGDEEWDIFWTDVGWVRNNLDKLKTLEDHQLINHFPNHYELTRKDLLVKNLQRMRRQFTRSVDTKVRREGKNFEFWPSTFVLPTEYYMFLEAFRRNSGSVWIMKPVGRAQGRGIFLFTKLSEIRAWRQTSDLKGSNPRPAKTADTYIVQKYIANPYTLQGKKFDFRLYALVTSFSPLIFWLYRGGLARFSHVTYSQSHHDMDNQHMHLTNASIQKTAAEYDAVTGSKWPLRRVRKHLMAIHGVEAVDGLFFRIQQLILRSLWSVQHAIIQDRHCFELYGYDVLIDDCLKPWLIEVNASPSLTGDTPEDCTFKYNLVQHTLDVLDVEGVGSGREKRIGGFDLVWSNGPVRRSRKKYRTNLGRSYGQEEYPLRIED